MARSGPQPVFYAPEEGANLYNSLLGKYYMSVRIGPYERPEPFEKATFNTKKTILLPLPQELRDDTSVSYENTSLASVGDLINNDIGSGVGSAVLRNSGDMATSALKNVTEFFQIGGVGKTISDILPADQITTALQQTLGTAPNPNPTVQFTGPSLREFNWSWSLYAVNTTESDNIRRLVAILKAAALPRNIIQGEGGLLSYPDMCQLNFFPWDRNPGTNNWGWGIKSIIKIKKCMISYVNVNYTPSNTPAFFKGDYNSPVAVLLSIGFKEIEYFVSEDWGGDGALYADTTSAFKGLFTDKLEEKGLGAVSGPITSAAKTGTTALEETRKALSDSGGGT